MTKDEHIQYWLRTAEDDRNTMNFLFKDGQYMHSLFFGHLYLEKVCKAIWIKNNIENTPPFVHNLIKILNGIETGLSEDDILFLGKLNLYQLSSRYPDYRNTVKMQTTKELTLSYLDKINKIDLCLRKKLL